MRPDDVTSFNRYWNDKLDGPEDHDEEEEMEEEEVHHVVRKP